VDDGADLPGEQVGAHDHAGVGADAADGDDQGGDIQGLRDAVFDFDLSFEGDGRLERDGGDLFDFAAP